METKVFYDTDLIGLPTETTTLGIDRKRFVTVNREAFLDSSNSLDKLALDLFPDVHLVAIKDKISRQANQINWIGRIEGAPKSRVDIGVFSKPIMFICNVTINYGNPGYEPAFYRLMDAGIVSGQPVFAIEKMSNKCSFPDGPLSGLDMEVDSYIGKILWCRPFYGWGWASSKNGLGPRHTDYIPKPFRFRLERICCFEDERRGGVGVIQEPGHLNNYFWIVFSLRHAGRGNFTDHVAHYNISIAENPPVDNENGWPVSPLKQDSVSLAGFCEISVQ